MKKLSGRGVEVFLNRNTSIGRNVVRPRSKPCGNRDQERRFGDFCGGRWCRLGLAYYSASLNSGFSYESTFDDPGEPGMMRKRAIPGMIEHYSRRKGAADREGGQGSHI